jgi:hypothetical protein
MSEKPHLFYKKPHYSINRLFKYQKRGNTVFEKATFRAALLSEKPYFEGHIFEKPHSGLPCCQKSRILKDIFFLQGHCTLSHFENWRRQNCSKKFFVNLLLEELVEMCWKTSVFYGTPE